MLHSFLTANRGELINRCREKVSRRSLTSDSAAMEHGIPKFLDQLTRTLHMDSTSNPAESFKVSGSPDGGNSSEVSEIGLTAGKHGEELLQEGFSIGQVVHDYGDLCQAVTELAAEKKTSISVGEFRTLNRCLDNAIAVAVTAYVERWDTGAPESGDQAVEKQLDSGAHEIRSLLDSVVLSLDVIKTGSVGFGGATAAVLDRNLTSVRHLIDRSFEEVRLEAGLPAAQERIGLAEFIEQFEVISTLEAKSKSIIYTVQPVDKGIVIDADSQLLYGAVSKLLQNAFKFTRPNGRVSLTVRATHDRISITIEDECGGLPPGKAAELVQDFRQRPANRTGRSHGLSITYRSVEANGGKLQLRDMPGTGCAFTIDMPRQTHTRE